ncbi:MAG: ROK family protein [Candidatus Symbiothrix sp.]|jgi:glucokinase|nr:ROK family protein [Candidatus Symbiothrix sp.]
MSTIGIDLGGTKINGAVFDEEGNILCKSVHLLEKRQGKEVGQLLMQTIDELFQFAEASTIEAIGICVPGISHRKTGCVWAPNINGWENYPLQEEIEQHIRDQHIRVKIASDRSCYILGETWKGAAKGVKNAVFIAIGTGIGMGILIDGRILHGHADIAGAAGWLALDRQYETDYVRYGCFESKASGDGIARCTQQILKESVLFKESILYTKETAAITAYDVFDAWEKNDPLAGYVIENATKMWGMAAANIVSLFNPEIIIWGGGVFGPAVQQIGAIYQEACRWAQPIAIRQVVFEKSQLCGDAGLYGAGYLAISE